MEEVRQWAIALCTAAVICTIFQVLTPKGGNRPLFHMMIAGFFLCCILSPLLKWKDISLPAITTKEFSADQTALSGQVEAQLRQQAETAIASLCERYLKNYDLSVEKVSVTTDTSEEGGIYISCVTLYLDKQNAAGAFTVRQLMEQQLGIPVEVITPNDTDT